MEELLDFLNELGYHAEEGEPTVIAFNDAVIVMSIEDGVLDIKVHQYNEVHFHADDINDLIDDVLDDMDEDEDDYEDEDELPFDIEQEIVKFMSESKFGMDDAVVVKGYEGQVFDIVGFGRFEGDTIYCLIDQANDDFYIEAYEEDMSIYNNQQPKTQAKQLVGGMLKGLVDELLDEYNDKMAMFMMFGDSEYYERCQEILKELEKIKL